jgi:hypothetical protein
MTRKGLYEQTQKRDRGHWLDTALVSRYPDPNLDHSFSRAGLYLEIRRYDQGGRQISERVSEADIYVGIFVGD